jgi:hypothetical protein
MKAWKHLLLLFSLLVVFEGALRKWVAPGLATPLYVLKDGVLLLALAAFFTARTERVALPPPLWKTAFPFLLGAYGFIVVLQGFNLRQPNLLVGLFGIKNHLLYASLLVLMPAVVRTVRIPSRWLKAYLLGIALPVLLLGVYQYYQPPGHWINRYVAETEYIAALPGGKPRITGTFSYIGGMSTFLVFNISVGLGLILGALWTRSRTLIAVAGGFLLFTLLVAPMNGSRSVLYAFVIPFPVLVYQVFKKPGLSSRAGGGLVIALILVVPLTQAGITGGWTAFLDRVEQAGDAESRIEGTVLGPFRTLYQAGPLGYGVGTTHQGAGRLVPDQAPGSWLPTGRVETQTTRLMLELGWLGWVVLMLLKLHLTYLCYQVIDWARNAMELTIGVAAFSFVSIQLAGSVAFNATTGALYWGLAGLALAVWSVQAAALDRARSVP